MVPVPTKMVPVPTRTAFPLGRHHLVPGLPPAALPAVPVWFKRTGQRPDPGIGAVPLASPAWMGANRVGTQYPRALLGFHVRNDSENRVALGNENVDLPRHDVGVKGRHEAAIGTASDQLIACVSWCLEVRQHCRTPEKGPPANRPTPGYNKSPSVPKCSRSP